jgi:hypothetical protein
MILIKNLSMGRGSLTVNLAAEELFQPSDEDCPEQSGPTDSGFENTLKEGAVEGAPPPSAATPSSGWYSEDCEDCCHPISDEVINYTEVVVAAFTSSGYTEDIACSAADVDRMVSEAERAGAATVVRLDPRAHTAGTLSRTQVRTKSDGTRVYELDYVADIPIDDDLDHLEVVTYMRVDFDRMKEDKQIDTSESLQNNIINLMGTKASHETVIELGKTREASFVYINPDNDEVWDGPVHNHPSKGIMAGAKHTKIPHPKLVSKRVPNIKIQNDNIKDDILSLDIGAEISKDPFAKIDESYSSSNKDQLVRTFISEPISSRAPDGKTRFLFYIDHANLVKSQSRYPNLKDSTVYRSAPIENLQVYRQRATDTYDQNEFGITKVSDASQENQSLEKDLIVSTSDSKAYSETPSMYESSVLNVSSGGLISRSRTADKDFDGVNETNIGSIKEISVMNLTDKGLRVFSLEDSEISTFTNGKFGYTTEIQFQDPTTSYLNEKLSELCSVKDSLIDLSSDINNLRAYDSTNKRLKDKYRTDNGAKHTSVVKSAVSQIIDIISVTTGDIDKRKINYLMSISTLQAGSTAGIETLVEIVGAYEEKLQTLLEGSLDIDNSTNANIEKDVGVTAGSNPDANLITAGKTFDQLIDRSIPDSVGVHYTGAQIKSFPQLGSSEWISDSSGASTDVADPQQVDLGDVSVEVGAEMSMEDSQDATLRAASALVASDPPPAVATTAEVSEDLLSSVGVTISIASESVGDSEEVQTFSSEAGTAIAGDSFETSDIEEDTGVLDCENEYDSFANSAIIDLGSAVVQATQATGDMDPDAPINQGQATQCDNDAGTITQLEQTPEAIVSSVFDDAVQVVILQGHEVTSELGPALVSEQYTPLTNSIIDRIPNGQSVLARLNTESTGQGATIEAYTENFLITNGTQTPPSEATNMSQRKQQVTNYVEKAFAGVIFESPSQITSTPIGDCKSEFQAWNVN